MIVGQLGKMTGTTVEGDNLVAQLRSFASVVDDTHLLTLAVGAGTLGLLLVIHFLRPRWPATLIAVAAATVVCTLADLENRGVAVVGAVPTGLPMPGLPDVTLARRPNAGARRARDRRDRLRRQHADRPRLPRPWQKVRRSSDPIDPQQELAALSGVHVAVGLMSGFPVSSSGSRTALAITAKARTQLYSVVAAAVVLLVLFVAGPLIENLPQASLAAVVFYAASKLVSWREVERLARFRTTELLLAVAAMLGTVLFGVLVGVGVAIALSLVEILYRLARPHEGVLGRVPGWPGCTTSTTTPTPRRCLASSSTATTLRCSSPTSVTCDGGRCSPSTRRTPPSPSIPCVGSSSTSRRTSKSTSPPPTGCASCTPSSPREASASPSPGSSATCASRSSGPGWPS